MKTKMEDVSQGTVILFIIKLSLLLSKPNGGVPRNFLVYSDENKNSQIRRMFSMVSKGHAEYQQILLRLDWLFGLKSLRAKL